MKRVIDGKIYSSFWQDRRNIGGSSIEVTEEDGENRSDVLEIFCKDSSSALYLSLFVQNVPVDIVEIAISEARRRLPDVEDPEDCGTHIQ